MKTFDDLEFTIDSNEHYILCWATEYFPNGFGITIQVTDGPINMNKPYIYWELVQDNGFWHILTPPDIGDKDDITAKMLELQNK